MSRGDDGWTLVFAAPCAGGFAVLHLETRPDGGRIPSGDPETPGPVVTRPGRPARRARVALRWEAAHTRTALAGKTTVTTRPGLDLRISPVDPSERREWWTRRMAASSSPGCSTGYGKGLRQAWFAYGPMHHRLRDLAPQQSVDLPMQLTADELEVPPGSYLLVAWLPSLDLRSDERCLTSPSDRTDRRVGTAGVRRIPVREESADPSRPHIGHTSPPTRRDHVRMPRTEVQEIEETAAQRACRTRAPGRIRTCGLRIRR